MPQSSKNILVHTIHDRALANAAERYAAGRLLDIGCGTKPYRELFAPHVSTHVGLDHGDTRHGRDGIDVFGSALDIPLDNASFDTATCNAVLEHLEEPEVAIAECFRILRPGGVAIYTVPHIWHLHEEPRDFYRFTKYGLRYLFEKVGFEVLELEALSGFWVTFSQLLTYNLHRLNRGLLRKTRLIDAMGLGVQALGYLGDTIDKQEKWTWCYLLVARKPE